ncbi:MAG: tetratricopeptide repeat protein [Proteobacteria bacterium]|nr:tetratricopeptide repeat protein [Pseudomonadota bacterium]
MSIILDALKRAQEERKKITQMGFPKLSTTGSLDKKKWTFYGVAGGLVCLILIVLFFPFQKKQVQVQTAAVKSQPVTVAVPNPPQSPPLHLSSQSGGKGGEGGLQPVVSPAKAEVPAKNETNISVPTYPVASTQDKKVTDFQPSQLKKQPEAGKKVVAAYVPKRKAAPRQAPDTQKTMLPQEDTRVAVKKVDDEKIMNTFNEAIEETKIGRLEIAKGLYLSILEEKPDYVEALNNLGVIAMREGNTKEALLNFRKCLGYKKDYAKAYNNIGLVMMKTGDTKVAEEYFEKSIEMDRDKVEPYINLTAILRGEKRYDEASNLLESLIKRPVKDASVYLSLAIIKDEIGKYSDAIKYYRYYLNAGGNRKERNTVVNRLKILEENQATANR